MYTKSSVADIKVFAKAAQDNSNRLKSDLSKIQDLVKKNIYPAMALEELIDDIIKCSLDAHKFEDVLLYQFESDLSKNVVEEHLNEHKILIRRLNFYKLRAGTETYADAAKALVGFLNIWIDGHVGRQDKHFLNVVSKYDGKVPLLKRLAWFNLGSLLIKKT